MSVSVASHNAILAAVAEQIEAALAPELHELQVQPYWIINPTPPAIDVYPSPDQSSEQNAFGYEQRDLFLTIRARVTPADSVAGQQLLVDMLDPRSDVSVIGALALDASFGGVAADSAIADGSPSGFIPYAENGVAGGFLLGAEWRLRVVPL